MRKKAITATLLAGAFVLAGCAGNSGGGSTGDPAGTESGAAASVDEVKIIVPADPGGGWDQTGRAVAEVITEDGLVSSAPVTNVGGAGGTVGLANLANETDPNTLMMTGLVMVGAVETNASATRIEDMTPIARLTDEPLIVVVPADSPYETLEDLVDGIEADGQAVTVTGGSAGGADHILAGLILTDAGFSSDEIVEKLNYIPNAGGGEAVTLLLGGNAAAGISGVGEFAEFVEDGSLRALAVSSEEPAALLPDVPTITDEGYDVVLTNWRGLLAPGGIDEATVAGLTDLITEMHETESWQTILEERGWTDAFLTGAEYASFLETNISEVSDTLKSIGLVQ